MPSHSTHFLHDRRYTPPAVSLLVFPVILLTGATGFIGSHLLKKTGQRFRFRCLVRHGSLSRIPTHSCAEIIEGDLSNKSSIQKAVAGVDTVLHLGALLRKEKPERVWSINVGGTQDLVTEAKKEGVRRFIFVSTENALREDLHDAYASSKREAEKIVQSLDHFLILRPCFIYGPGDDHGLGRLIECIEKSPVVPLFLNLKSQIQPLYIADAVEYLVRSLETNIEGAYILAGPEKINLNDFLKKICEIRNKKRLFIPLPPFFLNAAQRDNIYHSRTYSIEKTVKDFGYSPRGIEENLRLWFGGRLPTDVRL